MAYITSIVAQEGYSAVNTSNDQIEVSIIVIIHYSYLPSGFDILRQEVRSICENTPAIIMKEEVAFPPFDS